MFEKVVNFMNSIAKTFSDALYNTRLSSLEKASKIKINKNKKIDLNKLKNYRNSTLNKKDI